MVEDRAPVRRRRLAAHGTVFRRRRIFGRLREGFTYDEIAAEEGVSSARVRQIASEELQKRVVDSGADHAKLHLDRLAPAVQLGAEAIAAGEGIRSSPQPPQAMAQPRSPRPGIRANSRDSLPALRPRSARHGGSRPSLSSAHAPPRT
jgi:hypothetical protein